MDGDVTQPRRGARGSYAKSRRTRTMILDSALEVFGESGYRSGSLRGVAERVGMSEAGLLHHFTSKKALLAAVLERRDEQTGAQFDLAPGRGRGLLTSLVQLVEYSASTPGVVDLFCTLAAEATTPSHPAHQYFARRYVWATGALCDAFEELDARGELRAGVVPSAAARGTVAFMDGLQVQWLLDRESLDMAADLRVYLRSLVVGDV
jgi:AcrR family transcriptional regulator